MCWDLSIHKIRKKIMNIYQQNIIEHYKYPKYFKNVEIFDEKYELKNLTCGDEITLFQISNKLYFIGRGCALSMAAADILCEMVDSNELNITSAKNLTFERMISILGIDINLSREKCVMLAISAINSEK